MDKTQQPAQLKRRRRGFERASGLLQQKIRDVGEQRGFAVSRLLTHWAEIVGEDTARATRPVKVSYAKGSFGATLTVLTTGAMAPMIEAQLPKIRERVNACYGYAAIARIRLTQTAPTGFHEGAAQFAPAPKRPEPTPEILDAAKSAAGEITDDGLRLALARLGTNILTKSS